MTEVDICNLSLGSIGAARITALANNTPEGKACTIHYPLCRDSLLRSRLWKFAIGRGSLDVAEDTPVGFAYAYDLPADFLRLISTSGTGIIEGAQLLSDEATMDIRYVAAVTEVTLFDPCFTDSLRLQLALNLVMPLSQDKGLTQVIGQQLRASLSNAIRVNAIETDQPSGEPTWLEARKLNVVR